MRELLLRAARLGPKAPGYRRNYRTLARLKEFLWQETGRVIAMPTEWGCLRRLGIRRMGLVPKPPNRWQKSPVLRTLRQLRPLARERRPDEVVLFVDESEPDLNPKLGFDWCVREFRRWIRTPGDNRKLHLAMASQHGSRRLTVVHGRSKKVGLFLGLLEALLGRYRHKRWIYVIADNASIHKAAAVQEFVASREGGIEVRFLPPYCPEANPVEAEWQALHQAVTVLDEEKDLDSLYAAVREYLRKRSIANVRRTPNQPWSWNSVRAWAAAPDR